MVVTSKFAILGIVITILMQLLLPDAHMGSALGVYIGVLILCEFNKLGDKGE